MQDAVDLDDPDFWDKIAEKAELTIEEPGDLADELLMYEPRQRRQGKQWDFIYVSVQKFGFREDGDSEDEAVIGSSSAYDGGMDMKGC
jgi:hypothetical protein